MLPDDPAAMERARSGLPPDRARFRRWIADRASGVERPADYFETERVEGPLAVASPYRLRKGACGGVEYLLRWRELDQGGRVEFVVHSGGPPGIADGGRSQVRTGMSGWSNDPGSRARLVVLRTADQESEDSASDDGVNWIMYEDPHDQIEGSFVLEEGGTLATAAAFGRCIVHGIPGGSGKAVVPTNGNELEWRSRAEA
jgi:hypothetical protein